MHLGNEPKGLIVHGRINSAPYKAPHWNIEKRAKDKTASFTDVSFGSLRQEPMVSLEDLEKNCPEVDWLPQVAGKLVDEVIVQKSFAL